jgi:hypothetical protein
MLPPLVEVIAGLLAARQIEPVVNPVDAQPARLPRSAGTGPHLPGQPLQASDRGIVAENDLGRMEQLIQQCEQRPDPLFHRQRLRLHDQRVAKLIHDDTRQVIRFRPHQAANRQGGDFRSRQRSERRGRETPPHLMAGFPTSCQRPRQRRPQPGFIQHNPFAAQPPPNDLRPAVADARPQKTPARIAAFDDFAVGFRRR